MSSTSFAVAVLTLVLLSVSHFFAVDSKLSDVDIRIAGILDKAKNLYMKGVNVTDVVRKLDEVVELYERGDIDRARDILNDIEVEVLELEKIADNVYRSIVISKAITIAFLVSIPVAVYYFLPRVYLYIWFKLRRRWLVRG
ncbi:MAG: hypothetical protein LM582_09660 [Desulfurococcaceae archaeon]|jgi:hypothetical protein|nr:hypothetical protein [Desulfurococcaceae archaeon]